jgi:hypothetical protein
MTLLPMGGHQTIQNGRYEWRFDVKKAIGQIEWLVCVNDGKTTKPETNEVVDILTEAKAAVTAAAAKAVTPALLPMAKTATHGPTSLDCFIAMRVTGSLRSPSSKT